jgi:hypothetical protein
MAVRFGLLDVRHSIDTHDVTVVKIVRAPPVTDRITLHHECESLLVAAQERSRSQGPVASWPAPLARFRQERPFPVRNPISIAQRATANDRRISLQSRHHDSVSDEEFAGSIHVNRSRPHNRRRR